MPGLDIGGASLTTGGTRSMWTITWPRTPCPRPRSRGCLVTEVTCHAWQGPGSPRTSRVTWRRTSGSQSTFAAQSRASYKVMLIFLEFWMTTFILWTLGVHTVSWTKTAQSDNPIALTFNDKVNSHYFAIYCTFIKDNVRLLFQHLIMILNWMRCHDLWGKREAFIKKCQNLSKSQNVNWKSVQPQFNKNNFSFFIIKSAEGKL